jgi:hypothetical protein
MAVQVMGIQVPTEEEAETPSKRQRRKIFQLSSTTVQN